MKSLKYILAGLAIPIIFTAITFSQADEEINTIPVKNSSIEDNYISGLNSSNEDLRVNSAFILGELKSKKAVVPLMDMFRKDKDKGTKLVAALSLLKIGDTRGVFLVKRSIELEENNGMVIILQHLYNDYSFKTKEIKN